MEVSAI